MDPEQSAESEAVLVDDGAHLLAQPLVGALVHVGHDQRGAGRGRGDGGDERGGGVLECQLSGTLGLSERISTCSTNWRRAP